MKKFLITGLSVLFVALALFSCGSEDPKEKPTPTPDKEVKVDVLLNGVVVKNGAEVSSEALFIPPKGDNGELVDEYKFKNILGFKFSSLVPKEKYAFFVKKLGGDDVVGELKQVCLVGSSCAPVNDNTYSAFLDVKEANKEVEYELDYAIGNEKPTTDLAAKLFVELKKGDKLLHSFTINMTYKP